MKTMNHTDRSPKAVSYARFSSTKQAAGSSIERQEQAFLQWLATHKEYEPLIYADKGISAFRGKNRTKGGLAEILMLVKDGRLLQGDCMVIESMDRLSRQEVHESFGLVLELLKAGLSIVTLEDMQTYDKQSLNDSRGFVLISNLQAAYHYSQRLAQRISAAHEIKRAKARANTVPHNLVTVPWIKDGRLHEPFASLVKRAVHLYLSGLGHRAIVKDLQEIISQDAELLARYKKPIHATTVKRWLSSPELVGDWGSKDGLIEGIFEPLISHIEFQRIRNEQRRKTVKPSKQGSYLLSGLVTCSVCNANFHVRIQKPRPTKNEPLGSPEYLKKPLILYSNCSNYLKNGTCSNNVTWPYQALLFMHWYGLSSPLSMLYKQKESMNHVDGEIQDINVRLAELTTKSSRLEELYQVTGNRVHLDAVKSLKLEIDALETKKGAALERAADLEDLDEVGKAFQDYNQLSDIEKNAVLRRLNYKIFVDGKTARLKDSTTNPVFEIERRSQKYRTYILKVTSDQGDPEKDVRYFAVANEGENMFFQRFESVDEVLEMLEASKIGLIGSQVHYGLYE